MTADGLSTAAQSQPRLAPGDRVSVEQPGRYPWLGTVAEADNASPLDTPFVWVEKDTRQFPVEPAGGFGAQVWVAEKWCIRLGDGEGPR